jgi:diguanylate cyclase (GGDEF)-like protein
LDRSRVELARWGGEEFLLVYRPATAISAEALGIAILEAIGGVPFELEQASLPVTCSAGITLCRPPGSGVASQIDRIVERCDAALYEAKRQGRDAAVVVPYDGDAPHAPMRSLRRASPS